MEERRAVLHYLNERRALRFRPALLSLAALLAVVPPYPPNTRLYISASGSPGSVMSFLLGMAGACVVLGLALALYATRRPGRAGAVKRAYLPCAALYLGTHTAFVALLAASSLPDALFVAVGLVAGAAFIPIVLAWVECFAGDLRSTMLHGAVVCATSALITWLLSVLDPMPALVATTVLCAIGAFAPAALKGARGNGTDCGRPENASEPATCADTPLESVTGALGNLLSIIWLPALGFLVFVLIINAYEFPNSPFILDTEATGALLASLLALGVCLAHYTAPLVITIDKLVIPLCAACCIVLGSFPPGSPLFMLGAASVFAPLIFMSLYAISSLIVVAKAGEFPVAFVAGLTLFALGGTSMLGATLARAVVANTGDFGETSWIIVSLYFAVVIAALGYSAWRKECAPDEDAQDHAATIAENASDLRDELLGKRVDELSASYRLTEREHQILDYLSRGYNSTYIAKCLLISANTVRTHTHNLYRKMGVTSRGELLTLVNERHDGLPSEV